MTISENLTEWGGYQVVPWQVGDPLPDPKTTICRISEEYDDKVKWPEKLAEFLKLAGVEETRGIVVGNWQSEWDDASNQQGGRPDIAQALVAAKDQLSKLQVIFYGDITYEENEISWIGNTDLSPLLSAYPNLTHFGVRGGNGLSLGQMDLPKLRELQVQAGGLDAEVVRQVMSAKLPQLEHLELYLGTEEYGATSSVDDLTPVLDGTLFPRLKYLGLKNSDYEDQIAQVIADAPVLDGLETLDLSMGILTDEGAQALLRSERVKGLKKLDLHHHFMTDEMMTKLQSLGIEVDVSEQEDGEDDWRYVALGE